MRSVRRHDKCRNTSFAHFQLLNRSKFSIFKEIKEINEVSVYAWWETLRHSPACFVLCRSLMVWFQECTGFSCCVVAVVAVADAGLLYSATVANAFVNEFLNQMYSLYLAFVIVLPCCATLRFKSHWKGWTKCDFGLVALGVQVLCLCTVFCKSCVFIFRVSRKMFVFNFSNFQFLGGSLTNAGSLYLVVNFYKKVCSSAKPFSNGLQFGFKVIESYYVKLIHRVILILQQLSYLFISSWTKHELQERLQRRGLGHSNTECRSILGKEKIRVKFRECDLINWKLFGDCSEMFGVSLEFCLFVFEKCDKGVARDLCTERIVAQSKAAANPQLDACLVLRWKEMWSRTHTHTLTCTYRHCLPKSEFLSVSWCPNRFGARVSTALNDFLHVQCQPQCTFGVVLADWRRLKSVTKRSVFAQTNRFCIVERALQRIAVCCSKESSLSGRAHLPSFLVLQLFFA